jgi:hypothetical protein
MPDERDRPMHARMVARPAARTPIERANDHSLEVLILAARATSAATALCLLLSIVGLIWTLDLRWLAVAAVEGGYAAGAGWWGWWVMGNEGWRRGDSV